MSNLNDMQEFHKKELFYELANNILRYLNLLDSKLTKYQRQTIIKDLTKFRSAILNEDLNRTVILHLKDRLNISLSLGQSKFKNILLFTIIDSLSILYSFDYKIDQIVFANFD